MDGRTDGGTYVRTENLPILQDFVPYRGIIWSAVPLPHFIQFLGEVGLQRGSVHPFPPLKGPRASQAGLRPIHPGLRASQTGLRASEAWLAGSEAWLAGCEVRLAGSEAQLAGSEAPLAGSEAHAGWL